MARLSGTQGLDIRTIRQLFSRRPGEAPRVSPTKSRRAEGLSTRRRLDGMSIKGPAEARVVEGKKGWRTSSHAHGKPCFSGTSTCQRIPRTRTDGSRRCSVRPTSVCTPTRDSPGTNPQSRRSLFPRVPHPEKHHMLSPANNRSIRRRPERLCAGVIAGETKATNRRRIRASDGHLCVHTIGSFGLLVLGHSFHVPQPKSARMHTGKTGAFISRHAAAQ